MKRDWLLTNTNKITNLIFTYEYKCAARQKPEYFSRENGKIGFTNMIVIVLNFLTKSMQTELDNFFENVLKKTERVSKQAFHEARYKLKIDAFRMLFDSTAESAAQTSELVTYKGYRVLVIDGTKLNLEDTYPLRGYYGAEKAENCPVARASVLIDVLNEGLILDARIDKLSCGERELALQHHKRLMDLNMEQPSIILFDRGYASAEMFTSMADTAFVFRLQRKFNAKIDHLPLGDHIVDVEIKKRAFRLRVCKFKLSTGEIETLVTNLPKDSINSEELNELYTMRWGVETVYRSLKSTLQIENFSGTSQLIIEQDFFATMFLKNMVAYARIDANAIIRETENPENMYRKKVNENQLIGTLKDKLILAILDPRPLVQARKINAIIKEAVRHTIAIRPGRHFARKRKHSKRFHASGKSSL